MPRDIDAGVADLDDVYLYTIDDLDRVILEGQGNREAAAVEADRLLDEEIARYANIERSKKVAPVIAQLRDTDRAVVQRGQRTGAAPAGTGRIGRRRGVFCHRGIDEKDAAQAERCAAQSRRSLRTRN